jgi:hypothetical protein
VQARAVARVKPDRETVELLVVSHPPVFALPPRGLRSPRPLT